MVPEKFREFEGAVGTGVGSSLELNGPRDDVGFEDADVAGTDVVGRGAG